jgi:hypothetical protein
MKKLCLLISLLTYEINYGQPCTPTAISFIENQYLKTGVSNMGDIYPGILGGGLEYPKRTPIEIANGVKPKGLIFSGAIWLSAKTNGLTTYSGMRYRNPIDKAHFFPGPIRMSDGKVDPQSCLEFDMIWIVKTQDIKDHITKWISNATPLANINPSILDWPAKGNKRFTKVPIVDDLAPFIDVNGNGIYDPEFGDYPKIKGDEAHFTVMNDVSTGRLDSPGTKAVGIEMHMLTYIYYSPILNGLGSSLFHDCKIIKKTTGLSNEFIFSLFIDSDLGNYNDDYVGCDTNSNTGFTYNADDFDENTTVSGYFNNPPLVSTSFVSRKMNAFSFFLNAQGSILSDPTKPGDIRNLMEGKTLTGGDFTVSNDFITPGFPITKFLFFGNPSDSAEWSMSFGNFTPRDLRYIMSTETTTLEYNKPQEYNFVTYIHEFKPYSARPNFRDSVLPELIKVKNHLTNQDCKITLTAKITPDTNRMKKGKIEIISIGNSQGKLSNKWSSNETTQSISSKDSGKYRVVVIDSTNCMKDSTFYIPNISKGTGGISLNRLDDISAYPNPFQNQLTIDNPSRLTIERISIHDIIGKLVLIKNIHEKNERLDLNLNLLPRGNYQLTIQTNQGIKNFKISK